MKKLFTSILFLTLSIIGYSQVGTIKGQIKDANTRETLIGASVFIEGSTIGTITDFDGNFTLTNISAGTHTVVCSFISYNKNIHKGIIVKLGETSMVNFSMEVSSITLNDISVVASFKRESELALLISRKKSITMQENIGAQELSLQGISDAAVAATKISGISIDQSNKTLNVRGLGDRYNNTSLNGLPLPSNNAEYKNISLELFPTDIIEYISVDKSTNPQLSSEFSGANINIQSKRHSGKSYIKLGLKSSHNSNLKYSDNFYLGDGFSKFGYSKLQYPKIKESAWNYNFDNNWKPEANTINPNIGFNISAGKTFDICDSKLNVFTSLSFENKYSYGKLLKKKVNGSDYIRAYLEGEKYKYSTQSTGMINLNLDTETSKYYYNLLFMNSSDQELQNFNGHIIDLADEGAFVRRMQFERTMLLVNQLLANHEINKSINIDWGLAYNSINNIAPDRRHNTLELGTAREKLFATNDAANNNRYFHNLDETEYAANINVSFKLGQAREGLAYKSKISIGYSGKLKKRNFESTQFNHKIKENRLVDINDIDSYFNNKNYLEGIFDFKVRSDHFLSYSTYEGKQESNSFYASVNYNFNTKLSALFGLRYEDIYQEIIYNTALGEGKQDFTEKNLLPSLSLKYALSTKSNLRFAGGISYTLPQFKETALFQFEGITESTVGNPYLKPSKNYNVEIKWEVFPKNNELIAVSFFGKYIKDPINKFVMASASNDISYANTGDWAKIYGIELEGKKDLLILKGDKFIHKIFSSANISLMKTKQELNSQKISLETDNTLSASFNKSREELQGAAPFIVNANISYRLLWDKNNITSSIVYRHISDRINNIGYASLGNKLDKAENNLDIIIKSTFNKLGVNFSAKNLLNEDINRVQKNMSKDFLIKSYKRGITYSLGLTYKF